jgi:transposase
VKRHHLGRESWEAVIKAVEELKAPLKPLLQELAISRSSYYRRRGEYLSRGIAGRRKGSGRPKTHTVERHGKRIVEVLRQIPPTAGHRRVWVKLRGEGPSRNTIWRLMKEMGLLLPKQKGKSKRRYEALRAAKCDEAWTADTTY